MIACSPRPGAAAPTVAWFAIGAAVRPPITRAIAVGDCVRRALVAHSDAHPIFVGRNDDAPSTGHRHAFFLPADDDGDGRLDRVVVSARDGFDERAQEALDRLQHTPVWGHGGPDLRMTRLATCRAYDVGGLAGESMHGRAAQVGLARVWESHTPFVPPRFARNRPEDGVEAQARRMILGLGLPLPATITPLAGEDTPAGVPWESFLLQRQRGGGACGTVRGYGLRLVFDRPVRGPIALGYGAHQGLGQFVAVAR
ncbi:MAG: type I-U CRISPR-associated protein Cas5/Cas6 [Deltaproteobacteria bacterium]|nr:type I-U CRISPR-associated protein Cas5/Cas6 [Deltaproteobacteria bacterium]